MAIVDIILNSHARRLRAGSAIRQAIAASARGGGARVHETLSLAELEWTAREIASRSTDAVVLAGGDGSHMAGLSALSRWFCAALPPIALAPGGTVGTVARNYGLPGASAAGAGHLVSAVCAGQCRVEPKATLRVRDGSSTDRVGFIFGAGLVAGFFETYYAAPRQGLAMAALLAGRAFAGSFVGSAFARRVLTPAACTLSVDGAEPVHGRFSLVVASVVRDLGLRMRVTYRAGEAPDRFHLVASCLPLRALGPQVPRVLAGRPMGGERDVDVLAGEMGLRFDAPPGPYVLDGDLLRAGELWVEVGPVLPLLVPIS